MANSSSSRTHILRALGTEDVEVLLRWFVESRNLGWHPRIWWPRKVRDLEEKCQRILPKLDEYHRRRAEPK